MLIYILDPGITRDVLPFLKERNAFDALAGSIRSNDGTGCSLYRSRRAGHLEEWLKVGHDQWEWCEVDPISGSAPIKVWEMAKKRKL